VQAVSVGRSAILHNDRYGHSLGFSVDDVGCCHNYALCNLAWGKFLCIDFCWRSSLLFINNQLLNSNLYCKKQCATRALVHKNLQKCGAGNHAKHRGFLLFLQ